MIGAMTGLAGNFSPSPTPNRQPSRMGRVRAGMSRINQVKSGFDNARMRNSPRLSSPSPVGVFGRPLRPHQMSPESNPAFQSASSRLASLIGNKRMTPQPMPQPEDTGARMGPAIPPRFVGGEIGRTGGWDGFTGNVGSAIGNMGQKIMTPHEAPPQLDFNPENLRAGFGRGMRRGMMEMV